jgi:hypothetical protein
MHSLLQHCPTSIPHLDSHTSTPHCNAMLRKPLHAPLQRSTQYIHIHRMSHADAQAPITQAQLYTESLKPQQLPSQSQYCKTTRPHCQTSLPHNTSSLKLRVITRAFQGCFTHSHTLQDDANLQSLLQIGPVATTEQPKIPSNSHTNKSASVGALNLLTQCGREGENVKKMNGHVRIWVGEMAVGSDAQQLMFSGGNKSGELNGIYSYFLMRRWY